MKPTDIVDPEDWEPIPSGLTPAQKLQHYPQRLCQKMLGEQIKGLTTNPITASGGIKFDLEDIYLNLRLEPYKQLDTYPQPISAFERLNLSQLPTSGDTHFFEDDEQFIEQVLKPGCSESFRKRIAILGEPGAGKTTLLKKIAFHLLAQQLPKPFLVIWIFLADLQGQELEDYLLKVWLKQVLKVGPVTPDMEEALVEFFNQERVWLLLDGIDEMVEDSWQRQPEQFPKTRAELKKQFLEVLFNWNRERIRLTEHLKELLIKALGNLALEMFDEIGASGFRFSKKRLLKFLVEPNDRQSLCWIALELGWIAKLGGDKPFELVYALFHPTFQAYFAAQVIDDWDFFLPRSHINQPVVDETNSAQFKHYRVFEPQWKEVFLLWLGREDVPLEEKTDFLMALMQFYDNDGDCYTERARLLAAAGTAEFREIYQYKKRLTNEAFKQIRYMYVLKKSRYDTVDEYLSRYLIERSCGYFDEEKFDFYRFSIAIEDAAKSTLLEMDEQVVCPILAKNYWATVDLEHQSSKRG